MSATHRCIYPNDVTSALSETTFLGDLSKSGCKDTTFFRNAQVFAKRTYNYRVISSLILLNI